MFRHLFISILLLFTISLAWLAGCEDDPTNRIDENDTGDTGGDGDADGDGDTDTIMPPGCGDGILTKDEACDDGNKQGGDGCAENCRAVEPGYSCNPPGDPCQQVARCGDGQASFPELCDDGNNLDGDGCSRTCKVEIGFMCDGSPSVCTPTVCGDGAIMGAEGCDDGNAAPFDGCNELCQLEPSCVSGTGCTSNCGDGLVLNEDCDDGNNLDGDGCSADCTIEEGYTCAQEELGSTLYVPVVYRDFLESHSDFEVNIDQTLQGVVEPNLGADGKPVLAMPGQIGITSAASFNQWYNDSDASISVVSTLALQQEGANYAYVNCAFFPLDSLGYSDPSYAPQEVKKNAAYAGGCLDYNWEDAGMHAFYFTSEVRFWFEYTGNHTLTFIGDDDVWVFVNGRIAVDLGGIHGPATGGVTLSSANATTFGLEEGGVYEIVVFQAERHVTGSSYRLTLSGFNTGRSDCLPVCGDGEIGLGEECDDGVNDGGYGECGVGCLLGEYCGDGVVQENEDCDDGNNLDGDDCPSGCRVLIIE